MPGYKRQALARLKAIAAMEMEPKMPPRFDRRAVSHFHESERLLILADSEVSENMMSLTGESKADVLAAAQVHALLSIAAGGVTDQEVSAPF